MSKNNLWEKFDKSLGTVIVYAEAASIDCGVDCLYPESLAIGILTTGANGVNSILVKIDVDLEKCLKSFKQELIRKKKNNESDTPPNYSDIRVSRQVVEICNAANKLSEELDCKKIEIFHLFVALLKVSKISNDIFRKHGFKPNSFKNTKQDCVTSDGNNIKRKEKKNSESALSTFCTDVTEQARSNKLDPIIAREKEIDIAITILCRRGKNNPILLGEPGVGKTAIVEGISQRIVSGTVPKQLIDCKLYSLNISSLVSGTKYRGDFEKRIHTLVQEVRNTDNCILFIDEIHTLVGAGSAAGGALDASNILKPFLARSELRCIGATTLEDFKKYFQKDGALTRRFQQIMVEEPSKKQMYKILSGIKSRYEQYHNCVISDDSVDAIINLTDRYMPDKNFPDKAIDCMDMTCAQLVSWIPDIDSKNNIVVTVGNVAKTVSDQCQIPLEIIMWDDNERISKIEVNLSERVIGQPKSIDTVCRVLKNAYSGIKDPNRPIGSFIFGGQSGTGKTYMAKQLADVVFGKETSLIRLDMSEYSESHSISKLIGSPPGYVGFQETDVFVDKIKRKPYCIVLLDEIEKASPEVLKLFLQVMSDGVMTNAIGNKVDFKNVILVMTGNFGINKQGGISLGFTHKQQENAFDNEKQKLIDYCQNMYGAEFINRVDEFIPFMPLKEDSLKVIARIGADQLVNRLSARKRKLLFSDRVFDTLVKMSKKEYGQNATALNRLITKEIEPCISDALLSIKDKGFYTINIDVKNDKFVYRKRKRKGSNAS